jgi:hypothetical protein
VKQRQFDMIYSDQHMFLAMGGGSEIPYLDPLDPPEGGAPEDVDWDAIREFGTGTMTGVQWFDAVTGGRTGALVGPVWPVRATDPRAETGIYLPVGSTDHSLVKWESWVYTKVAGGIVIDFTDEIGKGGFDYAPIPEMGKTPGLRHSSEDGLDDMRAFAAFTYHAPLAIARRAHAAMPELYEIAPQDRPFDFYFDEARFRGGDPSGARVEVYFGVPMSAAVYLEDRDSTGLRAECRVALAAEDGEGILRSADELIYLDEGDRTGGDGIIPHLTVLDVPPGEYTVDVRMRNLHNSEIGVYRKRLEVEAYPAGSLMLSDIQLAWDVTEGGLPGKFTKNGLQVVPMPTRLYRHGESVYVYYEIYNLSRDEFGMTNYTVEYTVRSGKPPGSIQRILRAFKGGGSEEQVSVAAQEQLGVSETEPNYIELDLSAAEPGEVVLTVTVKDLVSGEEVAEEARFELAEREER